MFRIPVVWTANRWHPDIWTFELIRLVLTKLGYSLTGLRDTWRTEPSFRQWFALSLVSDVAALFLAPSALWIVLVVTFGLLILAAELINTAVEAIVDKTTPEQHELAKKAKDAGSAMTLVTFLALVVVWAGLLMSRSAL